MRIKVYQKIENELKQYFEERRINYDSKLIFEIMKNLIEFQEHKSLNKLTMSMPNPQIRGIVEKILINIINEYNNGRK